MPWYAYSGPRGKKSAKFRSYAKMGTVAAADRQHRGWYYHLVAHQSGSGMQRTRYAVSISDSNRNRVEYLRGFSHVKQATDAAEQWIDLKLGCALPLPLSSTLGTIPTLPEDVLAQENLAQENLAQENLAQENLAQENLAQEK